MKLGVYIRLGATFSIVLVVFYLYSLRVLNNVDVVKLEVVTSKDIHSEDKLERNVKFKR